MGKDKGFRGLDLFGATDATTDELGATVNVSVSPWTGIRASVGDVSPLTAILTALGIAVAGAIAGELVRGYFAKK